MFFLVASLKSMVPNNSGFFCYLSVYLSTLLLDTTPRRRFSSKTWVLFLVLFCQLSFWVLQYGSAILFFVSQNCFLIIFSQKSYELLLHHACLHSPCLEVEVSVMIWLYTYTSQGLVPYWFCSGPKLGILWKNISWWI